MSSTKSIFSYSHFIPLAINLGQDMPRLEEGTNLCPPSVNCSLLGLPGQIITLRSPRSLDHSIVIYLAPVLCMLSLSAVKKQQKNKTPSSVFKAYKISSAFLAQEPLEVAQWAVELVLGAFFFCLPFFMLRQANWLPALAPYWLYINKTVIDAVISFQETK